MKIPWRNYLLMVGNVRDSEHFTTHLGCCGVIIEYEFSSWLNYFDTPAFDERLN